MKLLTTLLTFLILILSTHAISQSINGYVFGYSVKTLNLRKKQPSFDGQLNGARISLIKGEETVATQVTNSSGRFSVRIPEPGKYRLVISKAGFAMVSANVVMEKGASRTLDDLFVMLKEEGKESAFCGTFTFKGREVSFLPVNTSDVKDDLAPTNIGLFSQSVSASMRYPKSSQPQVIERIVEVPVNKDSIKQVEEEKKSLAAKEKIVSDAINKIRRLNGEELDGKSIEELEDLLLSAKELMAEQDTSSVLYKELQAQIALTEQRLKDQKKIVELKEQEVSEANQKITYLGLFTGVLVLFLGILGVLLVLRRRYNRELKKKNDEISEYNEKLKSSIRYAAVIQKNFLKEPKVLKDLFSDSFLYYRPKEEVSGDFFWFDKVGNKRIVVAADCTGHGVPGAMLTVLGNAALNSIILEKGITNPKEILIKLNDSLRSTFRGEEEEMMPHGMDATVVTIDDNHSIEICGAVNGAYLLDEGELKYLDAMYLSLGEKIEESDLESHKFKGKAGQTLFLFSDGYHDQFKGGTDEIETYNLERFEKLLTSAGKGKLESGNTQLDKEFNAWKSNRDQVDDVLVIGVRL